MRLKTLLIPAAASLVLLAGCAQGGTEPTGPSTNGVENLSAEEILEKATDALLDAKSFRVKGSGEVDGDKITIDAVFAGDYFDGEFTAPVPGAGTVEVGLVTTEDGTYVRAGDDLWKAFLPAEAHAMLPLFSGKYVKVPAGAGAEFALDAKDILDPDGAITKGSVTEYKGQRVIELLDGSEGKMYVAIVGEPYPLAIVSSVGSFEFLEIDADVTVKAPPASDVLDLEQLMSMAG